MSKYRIKLNDAVYEMEIERLDEQQATAVAQEPPRPAKPDPKPLPEREHAGDDDGTVCSPMPGTVLKWLCGRGEAVRRGQVVLLLEAMKMENEIQASRDGRITEVYVGEGQSVAGGAKLFSIGGMGE